jgi:uroporphyrinogen-III decarboxylase
MPGSTALISSEKRQDRYFKDPELIAKGIVAAAKTYRADGIPLLFDLSVEAEAVGCELEYWEDNVPSVRSHPCEKQTPGELGMEPFSQSSGRWPVVFEAAALAKPQLDEMDCALLGLATGPLTLASHLAGVRIFTSVKKKEGICPRDYRFCRNALCHISPFLCPDGVRRDCHRRPGGIPDPAGDVSGVRYAQLPGGRRRHPDAGRTSTFFICGDCTKVIEDVCQVGTHGFAIDEQLNMNFIRDVARKYHKGFGGNLKLTLALSLGLLSPREDALVSLAAGGTQGYTFAPG